MIVPPEAFATLAELQLAAKDCRACSLWKNATQTVFGEGSMHADAMLVGEQPGDKEDRQGHPFVGPAGRILRESLEEAGIDPRHTYITNAVKHFKWTPSGNRRLHKKPNQSEVQACRLWLFSEIRVVRPRAILCMGATAAQSILGRPVTIGPLRGQIIESDLAPVVMVTVHPASLLRNPDRTKMAEERAKFVDDLRALYRLI